MFKKVTIIGAGLIGGSIGMAIRKKGLADEVWGLTRHLNSLKAAKEKGVVDRITLDLEEAVTGADLIIIAVPVLSIPKIAREIIRFVKMGAIITDVGSAKGKIVSEVERIVKDKAFFVGAHPMAGSEKKGVGLARADLFTGAPLIITKTKNTKRTALKKILELWRFLDAKVIIMKPVQHDRAIAAISHLPHLVATALVNITERNELGVAGAGFKDTTRIAAGDPIMWRDICLANKKEIIDSIERFEKELSELKKLIKKGAQRDLIKRFKNAKKKRESLSAGRQALK